MQPMQPIVFDKDGIIRFQKNAIVVFLHEFARSRGVSLNEMAAMSFSDEDRSQYAQLIGYSVSGFGDLSYADADTVQKADELAKLLAESLPSSEPNAPPQSSS